MFNSWVIPRQIQNIFLGKSLQKFSYGKNMDLFKKELLASDSRINVIWNNNFFEIEARGFSYLNAFGTTFNAICVKRPDGFDIQGKFEYNFIAKLFSIIFVIFVACILFSNENFIFGVFVLYLFIQLEGFMLLTMDSIFNSNNEQMIRDHLQKICDMSES